MTHNNLTYGEIVSNFILKMQSFDAIAQCFAYIKAKDGSFPDKGGVFVDIGSVNN